MQSLIPVSHSLTGSDDDGDGDDDDGDGDGDGDRKLFSLTGFISRPEAKYARSDTARQFMFANGRPVDIPGLQRVISEAFSAVVPRHQPVYVP